LLISESEPGPPMILQRKKKRPYRKDPCFASHSNVSGHAENGTLNILNDRRAVNATVYHDCGKREHGYDRVPHEKTSGIAEVPKNIEKIEYGQPKGGNEDFE